MFSRYKSFMQHNWQYCLKYLIVIVVIKIALYHFNLNPLFIILEIYAVVAFLCGVSMIVKEGKTLTFRNTLIVKDINLLLEVVIFCLFIYSVLYALLAPFIFLQFFDVKILSRNLTLNNQSILCQLIWIVISGLYDFVVSYSFGFIIIRRKNVWDAVKTTISTIYRLKKIILLLITYRLFSYGITSWIDNEHGAFLYDLLRSIVLPFISMMAAFEDSSSRELVQG